MMAPFRLASGGNRHSVHRLTAAFAPILVLLMTTLLAAVPAKADVTLGTIGQAPQNTVSPGQAVTYTLQVSSNASPATIDYVSYNILLNGTDIGSQFTPADPCSHDGSTIYCAGNGITLSSPQTYQVTWNNPAPGSGSYQITFQVQCSTGSGAPCSGTSGAVTTVVSAPPVANRDSATTTAGQPVTIDVLANDSGPTGVAFSISSVTLPVHGTATNNDGMSITYIPAAAFSGTDRFSYTIRNANGQTASAAVDVTVAASSTGQAITHFQVLPGLTPNEYAIAVALDKYCADSGDAQTQNLCGQLNSQSVSDQIDALQQITPNQVASEGTNGFLTTYTQLANIRMRLLALRRGSAGPSAAGFSLAVQGQTVPAGRLLASLLGRADREGAGADDSDRAGGLLASLLSADGGAAGANESHDERLGVFVNGHANFGSRDTTTYETGFGFDTLGITMGMDYRFSARLVAGGAMGFASTSSDFNAAGGKMKAQAYSVSTYGSYYLPKDFFVDWIGTYVHSTYDLKRSIVFAGLNSLATSSTGGDQYALAINAGRDFYRGGFLFTPYARVEYIATGIDAYQENSTSGLAMAFNHQSLSYLTSVLAGRISRSMSMTWGVLSPSLHLEWVHQYENGSRLIGGHFVGDPGASFNIGTDAPDRNYLNAGLDLVVTLPRGLSGFLNYETMLARDYVSNTMIQLGGRMQF